MSEDVGGNRYIGCTAEETVDLLAPGAERHRSVEHRNAARMRAVDLPREREDGPEHGAVAGLAGVTQTAGFVTPMSALIIGVIAGTLCFFAVTEMKKRLGYDDSLDAFGVHGISGFTGAILVGIFANSLVNPMFKDANGKTLPSGLIEGNTGQLTNQMIGALIAVALSVVGTYILLVLVDKVIGLRVSGEDETQGLDLTQHGEDGYNFDYDVTSSGVGGMSYTQVTDAIRHGDRVTE